MKLKYLLTCILFLIAFTANSSNVIKLKAHTVIYDNNNGGTSEQPVDIMIYIDEDELLIGDDLFRYKEIKNYYDEGMLIVESGGRDNENKTVFIKFIVDEKNREFGITIKYQKYKYSLICLIIN